MGNDDWTHDEDYTRVRFHAQRGSGTDNRGDVTVEVSRNSDDTTATEVRRMASNEFRQAVSYLEDEILGLNEE